MVSVSVLSRSLHGFRAPAAGLLAAVVCGCRLCLLFDTRVEFEEWMGEAADGVAVADG